MSNILKKYDELKDTVALDAPQPKMVDGNKLKDLTPYTKGNRDIQVADDESGILTLEKATGLNRYGLGILGMYGSTPAKKYGSQERK